MLCKGIFVVLSIHLIKCNADVPYINIIHSFGNNLKVSSFGCNNKEGKYLSKKLSADGYGNKYVLNSKKLAAATLLSRRHVFVVDLDCKHSSNLLIQANEDKLFAFPFTWLAFYETKHLDDLLKDVFSNLSILVDSNFNLVEILQNENLYLRKIYKKHLQEVLYSVEDFGLWNNTNEQFKVSRKNLGIVLNSCLVITNNDSLNHLTDKRNKHVDGISKVSYVVLSFLASIYNITLKFTISDSWGYKINNSHWTGMMGELVGKKADIGGTSLFILKNRIDVVDYIALITSTRAKFVFRQPQLSYISNVYTLPFDSQVWISTGALVTVMMLTLVIVNIWEREQSRSSQPYIDRNEIELNDIFPNVALITVGAICQQGSTALPYSVPSRIVIICLFVSLMFIYVSYSANIVALLQTSSTSIKTLEDLSNSRISAGVDDTVYNRFYFPAVEEPARKALYEKKIAIPGKSPNYMHIEEGVRRIKEGLFAFHMETGAGYKIISETFKEDEKCGLQEIAFLQVVDPWLSIQKNSPYKEMLKIGLHLLRENGIQQRENNLIYTKKPICTSRSTTFVSVGIVDCYPAALILAGGIASSIVVLILELYL